MLTKILLQRFDRTLAIFFRQVYKTQSTTCYDLLHPTEWCYIRIAGSAFLPIRPEISTSPQSTS